MTLEKVIKHFENALEVMDHSGETGIVDLKRIRISKDGLDSFVQNPFKDNWLVLWTKTTGFAKILTTKQPSFSITKEQLRQLTDPKVKEWFPEVFNLSKDFTGWLKTEGELNKKWICYFENGFQKYGICSDGNWFTQNIEVRINANDVEATEQEVFEALKNEANKRGFVDGAWTISVKSNYLWGIESNDFGFGCEGEFQIDEICIFDKGNWATIITTITKSEAEKLLNKKIIG